MQIEGDVRVRVRANQALKVEHSATLVSDLKQLGCVVDTNHKLALSKSTF